MGNILMVISVICSLVQALTGIAVLVLQVHHLKDQEMKKSDTV